jgi:hypothetical protein
MAAPAATGASSVIASSRASDTRCIEVLTVRPLAGISAAAMQHVVAAAGGRGALAGKSTEWLKAAFVVPVTAAARASYADAVLRAMPDAAALVGRATQFFSHAYTYSFLDAVDAIAAWDARNARADGQPNYFYFDLLVVNQHAQHSVVPFEVLRDEFGSGVRSIGATLFLLDFAEPVSLARAWCVFEVATSLACGALFTVVMAPRSEAAFRAALVDDLCARSLSRRAPSTSSALLPANPPTRPTSSAPSATTWAASSPSISSSSARCGRG